MDNSLINILDLFDEKVIRIPAFQRGYSWDASHLEALWKDIYNVLPNYNSKQHFTGIIVLEEVKSLTKEWKDEGITKEYITSKSINPYSLVDGQQRLTSLIILIFTILQSTKKMTNAIQMDSDSIISKLIYKQNKGTRVYQFGYEVDTPSHYHLLRVIFEDNSITTKRPPTIYTSNLDGAKEYFANKLKDYNSDTKSRLLYIILNQLKFSLLVLDNERIDISMVFETLNFRGKPLSYLELLKNRILFLLSRSNIKRNIKNKKVKIVETWFTIYEYLGKNERANSRWIKEDEFIIAFWIINFNHHNRNHSEFKLEDCVDFFFDLVFPISNERNQILETNEIVRFLKSLELCIRAFYYIENPKEITDANLKEEPYEINKLNSELVINYISKLKEIGTGWKSTRNIIVAYVISDSYSKKNLETIVQILERHNFVVYSLFGKRSNNNTVYIDRFVNRLFREDCHAKCVSKINELCNDDSRNYNDVINHIHNSREINEGYYNWNGLTYFLKEYERFLNTKIYTGYVKLKNARRTKILDPRNNRPFRTAFNYGTREQFENSLGNIVLSQTDRSFCDFDKLLNRIENNGTASELNIQNFTISPDYIFNRGVQLFKFIAERWNLSLPVSDEVAMKKILFNKANIQVQFDESLQVTQHDDRITPTS